MELTKTKFKETELGLIPEDWVKCNFQDVIEGFSSGMTPYRGNPEYYKGNIPWITSGELNYNIILDTEEKITDNAVIKTNLKILPVGTFLIAITGLEAAGTRGSCGITGLKATTNQSCMALFPKKGKLATEYLYHFYSNYGNELAFKFCQGTKQQSYTGKIAKILPINLPPTIEEQIAIAQVLSDTDNLIQAIEQKLTKKRAIKQGAMQQLLTPKEGWEVKKLGEVCDIKKGQMITSETKEDGIIPVIAGGKKPAYFHNKYNRIGKTITVSGSGANAGYIAFHNYPIFASDCSTISEARNYSIEFIFFLLQEMQERIYKMQTGGAQPHIHPKDLNPIVFAFPEIQEQTRIAKILSDMDAEITQLEEKLSKYKMLKQGLMQNLLTGKIRLV